MILATPAIALRVSPFSRTSRMVTWLTPAYGRLVTSIKGACRPKSAFLGQFDLASRCELLFYRRERDGVVLDPPPQARQLEGDEPGSTEVTYQLEADLIVPIPGFIKRRTQGRIMHTALRELKARAERSGQ